MSLVSIQSPDIIIDLAYATPNNFIGRIVYHNPHALLHIKALEKLENAAQLAKNIGYRLKILDAFRPTEAQWALWEACPNPRFVADPRKGSSHSRGIAVDLTLADKDGVDLDMGTPFDHLTSQSYHGDNTIPKEAQKNRLILLGIMALSGWDHYNYEWWHYQLFNPEEYPLLSDKEAPHQLMKL